MSLGNCRSILDTNTGPIGGSTMTKKELLEELADYPDDAEMFQIEESLGDEYVERVSSVQKHGYRINKYKEYADCKRSDCRHVIGALIS